MYVFTFLGWRWNGGGTGTPPPPPPPRPFPLLRPTILMRFYEARKIHHYASLGSKVRADVSLKQTVHYEEVTCLEN